MKFEPTYKSVSQHKVPAWYDGAKLGIFIHWSLFSVPAYAAFDGRNIMEMQKENGIDYTMQHNPYAEWYLNTLRIEGSPTREYHEKTYGKDFSYFDFQKEFEEKAKNVDFNEWAEFFKECGAQYAVLVTKHHDGYCLWPSEHKNPFDEKYQSSRDLVGEWAEAVRSKGMRAGLYYSGIFDWTFKKYPIDSRMGFLKHTISSEEYAEYATKQLYELIEKYKPSVLWNDIGYPASVNLNQIFADYYNTVEDGVVNNRWAQTNLPDGLSDEELMQRLQAQKEQRVEINIFGEQTHCDYVCPEYVDIPDIQKKKFEADRGVGLSFGYNQNETEKEMLSPKELIHFFIDVVSKNGNLLINVGPMADGTIPEMQRKPLRALGEWMKINGEAIYGTRPWDHAVSATAAGKEVRFTTKPDALYAAVLDEELKGEVVIKELEVSENSVLELLGYEGSLQYEQEGKDLKITLPADMKEQYAHVIRIK